MKEIWAVTRKELRQVFRLAQLAIDLHRHLPWPLRSSSSSGWTLSSRADREVGPVFPLDAGWWSISSMAGLTDWRHWIWTKGKPGGPGGEAALGEEIPFVGGNGVGPPGSFRGKEKGQKFGVGLGGPKKRFPLGRGPRVKFPFSGPGKVGGFRGFLGKGFFPLGAGIPTGGGGIQIPAGKTLWGFLGGGPGGRRGGRG